MLSLSNLICVGYNVGTFILEESNGIFQSTNEYPA